MMMEEANGTVKQNGDFPTEPPTADKAGLLSSAEGGGGAGESGGTGTARSPDGVSGSSVESGTEVSPLHLDQEKTKSGTWQAEGLRVIIISCVVFSLSVTVALIVTIYYGPPQVLPHGAVSSTSGECARIGTHVLQNDGSAVDAAVATVLCEGVVSSHLTGIGGEGFLIYRDNKRKRTWTVDFRGAAPDSASENMYDSNPMDKQLGPKSVAVPGLLKGLAEAHKKHGKKPWKELVMPSVRLARDGFNATAYLVRSIKENLVDKNGKPINDNDTRLNKMYLIDGRVPQVGETLRFPELADTLELVAEHGPDVFYNGNVAKEIARDMELEKGYITIQDLRGYAVTSPQPIQTTFKNMTVETLPPPAGGAAILSTLNVMDLLNLSSKNKTQNLTYHYLVEAMKFSEAMHDTLGDPKAFPPGKINDLLKNMISKETALKIKNKINETSVLSPEDYGSLGTSPDHGTQHVSVISPDEVMVSVTTSLNNFFGSRFVTSNGILLNDVMDDFSLPQGAGNQKPNTNNLIAPNKRPLSNMAPSVVYTEHISCARRMAIGGTNGYNITNGIAEVLVNLLGFEDTLSAAVEAPRFSPSRLDSTIYYEDRGPNDTLVAFLASLGHNMKKTTPPLSMINAVSKNNETLSAVSDPRAGGTASLF